MNISTLLMPYDIYERHAVVSRLLHERIGVTQVNNRVLDIGGRIKLLEQFIPYPIFSLNADGSGQVLGDGCAIPYADNCFAAAVSIDTLEHLPRENRLLLLQECLRVAQCYVIVAAPFGSAEHQAYEKRLQELHLAICGQLHPYLSEHIQYGLPTLADLHQFERQFGLAKTGYYFAGDYVWQGKVFERGVLACRQRRVARHFFNLYNYIVSLALFHPIRLRRQPDETTNRFYLLLEK